ncbi:hypothetical protein EAH57_14615 [Acinetobacter sp. 2JN-4]|uniref:hypothetical protein n=1 Tax=Acinetobacter sp. 2JN-4 TaxID=2479844 RepID=UPI000EF9DA6F|nr:hypothetical protein [Acinetobacter sp. 2JN-4]RLZ06944.1 hypothetical protein EAH57_14615 [Acinetobacter sp. 2JN-4]
MKLSSSTKMIVVTILICVCSAQTNARRLYKWVDQGSVTNYSEFQPREGTSRKLEVLESRGNGYVDPAMAVTAEMKAIEIPVDQTHLQSPSTGVVASSTQPQPTTQTIVKQGMPTTAYSPSTSVIGVPPPVEKKEAPPVQQVQTVEKKEITTNPLIEKPSSAVIQAEKRSDLTVVVQIEKKIPSKINPWTRSPHFSPSNLVPQNLPKNAPSQ